MQIDVVFASQWNFSVKSIAAATSSNIFEDGRSLILTNAHDITLHHHASFSYSGATYEIDSDNLQLNLQAFYGFNPQFFILISKINVSAYMTQYEPKIWLGRPPN